MADVGIRTPFQFNPTGTLALARDAQLIQCHVNQVVNVEATDDSGTTRGEYEWQTELGSFIDLARHHSRDFFEDLLDAFVEGALSRWVLDATFVASVVERVARLFSKARIAWTYKSETERRAAEADLT